MLIPYVPERIKDKKKKKISFAGMPKSDMVAYR